MEIKNSEYVFKRVSPELYPDLIVISKSAFGIDPGIQYYIDKNDTSKFGIPDLGYIAYTPSGTPAAFYGVYSQPLIRNGKEIHAVQSGDTMTHKDHMGKGLFTTLANLTYQLAQDLGIEFVFGFPNNNSFPGFQKKLNWKFEDQLKEYRFNIFTFPLSKIVKKLPVLTKFYKFYSHFVLKIFSTKGSYFKSSTVINGVGGINRTKEFYNYKFKSGNFIIKISELNVWLKIDGFLFIGDIETEVGVDYFKFIKKLKRLCFILGVDTIVFQTSPESFLDLEFRKKYESKPVYYVGFRDLNLKVEPSEYKFVFGDVDTF